jgi:hypothetical protein
MVNTLSDIERDQTAAMARQLITYRLFPLLNHGSSEPRDIPEKRQSGVSIWLLAESIQRTSSLHQRP